jgi:hypothetical protein
MSCLFIRLLLNLGFLISWKKSQILPSQDFLFLGEHYRTDLGFFLPPEEKFQSRTALISSKLMCSCCWTRDHTPDTDFPSRKAPHLWRLESVYRVREGTGWSKATPGSSRSPSHSTSPVLYSGTLGLRFSSLGGSNTYSSCLTASPRLVDSQGKCSNITSA